MEKDFKPVKSVYGSNYEVIKNIMELYNIEQFDLDCTYSKGNFWKDLPQPINKSDIYPFNDTVIEASQVRPSSTKMTKNEQPRVNAGDLSLGWPASRNTTLGQR